ncbi:hypothetical protein AV530_012859 [Patagioenas fasciata monilis]|uniref:Uncharacterized protein n=1 Tax=Patagioenas fasciata monilis TaxID=372326 RepID=A0A1V4J8Y6_PATFA|nr:hypothetical protein AV530_012859 [Patagioenas fasciata monilis]
MWTDLLCKDSSSLAPNTPSFLLTKFHNTASLLPGVRMCLCLSGIPIGCCPLMFVERTAFGKLLLDTVI